MTDQREFFNKNYHRISAIPVSDFKIVNFKKVVGKKILNIGGGTSSDIWFLAENNDVYLLDISETAVNIAKKNNIKGKVYDVTGKIPFKSKKFDIVILKDILEHLLDPEKLLLESRRILKDGGYIVLSIPNHFSLWFRLRILFGHNLLWKSIGGFDHTRHFEEWNYMHIRFFTWRGLNELIEKCGFKIKRAFWDFDTLAHYNNPQMYYTSMRIRAESNDPVAVRFLKLYRIYVILNILFPKRIRSYVVSLNPGLLCSGFYLHLAKK